MHIVERWILLALLAVLPSGELLGQAGGDPDPAPADEGALFLLLPVGAQAVGIGRAMTALESAESVFWNPAGLVGTGGSRVVLHRGDHVIGDATTASVLLSRAEVGTLGVSYQLFDVGTQDVTDGLGNVLGSISIRNHQAVLSGAARLGDRLSAGMNVKHVRFEVACRGQCPEGSVRGSSFAVDLGLQSQPFRTLPLRLGVLAAHLGPDFQVENAAQADPLPSRIRVGAAYEVFERFIEDERVSLALLVEAERRLRGGGSDPAFLFGTELSAGTEDRIQIRGGYILGEADQLEGAAVGLGIRYDRLQLDIARALARTGIASQQEPVHVTLAVRF